MPEGREVPQSLDSLVEFHVRRIRELFQMMLTQNGYPEGVAELTARNLEITPFNEDGRLAFIIKVKPIADTLDLYPEDILTEQEEKFDKKLLEFDETKAILN